MYIYISIYINWGPVFRGIRARWPRRLPAGAPRCSRPASRRTPVALGRCPPVPGQRRGRSSFPPETPSVAFGSKSDPSGASQGAPKLKR